MWFIPDRFLGAAAAAAANVVSSEQKNEIDVGFIMVSFFRSGFTSIEEDFRQVVPAKVTF